MITGLTGILDSVADGSAYLTVSGITYEVFISPVTAEMLIRSGKVGSTVSFSIYHYIEGAVTMGSMVPRMIGFLTEDDRRFFTKLTGVQGLGVKKAIKALVVPVSDIARAIEQGEEAALVALPEIGKKTAQKIIMELKGSMASFISEAELTRMTSPAGFDLSEEFQHEAVEILRQLQYSDQDARAMVKRTSDDCPHITTADTLIQEIFKRTGR